MSEAPAHDRPLGPADRLADEGTELRTPSAPGGDAPVHVALRESELRYRRLFEAARDGILILESESGRITDVNPFLVELLGFTREEMLGKTVGELSPFKDIESNATMLERLQSNGYVRYEHLPLRSRGGRPISVEFVSNVYQAGDKSVIQCNIRDITERHAAQEKIRELHLDLQRLNRELDSRVVQRTAQLRAANEELEAFSYSVSHDLRAPLRHIGGFIELLRNDTESSLSETGLRHMTVISESVVKLGTLIDDLLAFSHIGRTLMETEEVDLGLLVDEVRRELELETAGRDIVWDVHVLPQVQADRALLRLVLLNLIGNAVKFTHGRSPARIEIGCEPSHDPETVVFIRDNGAGFDPRYAHKLFGVFQRLHTQAEFSGTGIGLANVHRIIRRHGGRTWAEGIPHQGATFHFSLPLGKTLTHVP